jgi:hypothetical protein
VGGVSCICISGECSCIHPSTRILPFDLTKSTDHKEDDIFLELLSACMRNLRSIGMRRIFLDNIGARVEDLKRLGQYLSPYTVYLSFLFVIKGLICLRLTYPITRNGRRIGMCGKIPN